MLSTETYRDPGKSLLQRSSTQFAGGLGAGCPGKPQAPIPYVHPWNTSLLLLCLRSLALSLRMAKAPISGSSPACELQSTLLTGELYKVQGLWSQRLKRGYLGGYVGDHYRVFRGILGV